MRVILDSNIYDKLSCDKYNQVMLNELIEKRIIIIIVTRTICEELKKSPFNGIPNFFKTEYSGNTVGLVGIMCAGDSIGSGNLFKKHLGNSKKINDALIADVAELKADILVSDDKRLYKRLKKITIKCEVLTYIEFINKIKKL